MRPWAFLSAVLYYLSAVVWPRSTLYSKRGFIYGRQGDSVKIYVKLYHNSPILVCMDLKHAGREIIDPVFEWIGPNEKKLTGNSQINMTNTGNLEVKNFTPSSSGLYTCNLSFKSIGEEIHEEKTVTKKYEFLLFVNPFAPGWKATCNQSVDCEDFTNYHILQARDRIEEFFRNLGNIFHQGPNKTVPAMRFIDHSLQVGRMDSCRPGFGKNEAVHSNCATCCVVCNPGTYSPDADVTCQTCVSIHVYGAISCP
ncbi:PREDICTED: zona pellucida-binding protein 2 [Elephantulus edwardii]|uniref:zona pellucida-binding protein 2 n=1 Tax=Elephantulus edwardii TaxID=28737 RepID=UPI0003F0E0BE|nr:PREDICTED: zona pellucida-binding protein 2 [Elephantulus edwardii]